jgi:hypothetical protein
MVPVIAAPLRYFLPSANHAPPRGLSSLFQAGANNLSVLMPRNTQEPTGTFLARLYGQG